MKTFKRCGLWALSAAVPTVALSSLAAAQTVPGAQKTAAAVTGINVVVDTTKNRHSISPLIYGAAYANDAAIRDLRLPIHRMGGNNTSRYNWRENADNRGNDWFFQSIGDSSATPGERGDTFITRSRANGAQPMLTIPLIGYVAKLGTNRSKLWSYSVSKYGAQQRTDAYNPDSGNGVRTDGTNITGNNPLDANVVSDPAFQTPWIQSIVQKFGTAGSGGLQYYILDNEPGIWHATHRDVHPTGATMDEVRDKSIAMARAIKNIDTTAQVAGPEEWGWTNYLYSGYDSQWGSTHGWSSLPDRQQHGGKDFVAYYLESMKNAEAQYGKRLLDVFTLHIYPQGGEFSNNVSQAMQQRRNRSTRALFDPTYKDETWINDYVRLIPRMQGWVNANYPGTKIGITEYNWGAEGHINGATTQADIYGIFGRENLQIGTRWTTPAVGTPTYNAMKLFRNYDGSGSGFGDTSISATSDAAYDTLTTYAATRSNGTVTVLIVSKGVAESPVNRSVKISLVGTTSNTNAQVWRVGTTNNGAIQRQSDIAVSKSTATVTVPTPSVTLLVIPATQ